MEVVYILRRALYKDTELKDYTQPYESQKWPERFARFSMAKLQAQITAQRNRGDTVLEQMHRVGLYVYFVGA